MKWRKFLEESGQNVWTLIRDLIQVAVEDYPDELRLQRDSFAEQLFCLPPHGNACYRDAKHADPGDCKPALFAAAPAPAPPAAAVAQPATGAASRRPHGRQRIYRPGDDDEDDDEPQPQQLQQLEPELRRDGKGGASAAHSGGGDSDEDVMVDRRRGDADEDTGSEGEDKDVHDPVDYETALQLTQDLEDERLRMDQITKIGRKLEDKTMGEDDLYSFLRRLEEMHITTEVLKHTGIAKRLVPLRNHSSKPVRNLARELLRTWKEMANVWMNSAGSVAKSLNDADALQPDDGELGLPSPPMDAKDLLASNEVDFSQVVELVADGDVGGSGHMNGHDTDFRTFGEPLDDRPHSSTKLKKKVERRNHMASSSSPDSDAQVRERRERASYSNGIEFKESRDGEGRQTTSQQLKSSRRESSYSREEMDHTTTTSAKLKTSSTYSAMDRDPGRGSQANGYHVKKTEHTVMRKAEQRPALAAPSKPRPDSVRPAQQKPMSPELTVAQRLAAAKRKLHERYEEAEAVKKSRTVQVMDLHELPKGGPNRAKHPNAAQKPKLFKSSQSVRR